MQDAKAKANSEPDPGSYPSGGDELRIGRALIGWIPPEQGKLLLAHNKLDGVDNPGNAEKIMAARGEVACRSARAIERDAVVHPPGSLNEHIAALAAAAPEMYSAGWQVKIVDLRQVRALQPVVFTEDARARVKGVDPTDLLALARLTVPLPSAPALPLQFDQIQRVWTINSRNPNLRIVGQFAGPTPQGPTAVGFLIRELPSYLQVAVFQGRHLLHDGYHRALGLLARGVNHVPAFVREFGAFEEMGINPGMLPQDAYLGQRPPILADYLDDRVAATVAVPFTRRMIVIGGFELSQNQ
jgi:hypothetical protein